MVASSPESVGLVGGVVDERQVKELCRRLLPGWADLGEGDMQVAKISGGISNSLVKVTPTGAAQAQQQHRTLLPPVAVKVFGEKTELLVDRQAELRMLLQLNEVGFGAQVLAVFENGRVEEFVTAYTLTPQDMSSPAFVPRIARRLRQLHEVNGASDAAAQPQLFATLNEWLCMARELRFEDAGKQAAFEQLDLQAMAAEVAELQGLCAATGSPVVLSHNDLLSGNILVLQEPHVDVTQPSQVDLQGPLQLIDFEYSAPSFRGFDLGNHFNEYAGFDCDYTQYPDVQAQALFFRHYMTPPSSAQQQGQQQPHAPAGHSPIDFDYLEYSGMRWAEYHRRKPEFVGAAQRVFGPAGRLAN